MVGLILALLLGLLGGPCVLLQQAARPASDVEARMKAMSLALGVECTHCHVPDRWTEATKAPFGVALGMLRMVDYLNANQLSEVEGITCWTCHAGSLRPSRLQPERLTAAEALWPPSLPGGDDSRRLAMAVYSASLGVGCDHCHVAGDWKSGAKPAYRVVSKMNAMFDEFPKFMPKTARTQCFMCHKGAPTPKRAPPTQ
jgi:hypothetical protein